MDADRTIVVWIRRGDPTNPFEVSVECDVGDLDCYAARAYLSVALDALDPGDDDDDDDHDD